LVFLAAFAAGAAFLYAAYRIAPKAPGRRRRHGPGQIRQAIDHRFGQFGGSYPEDVIQREAPKIGRNDPCSCGSRKKYKRCCGL
jgi:preprotein translocase subunit SecA